MRNVDRIKALENEVGRYQKKVSDQYKELCKLRGELEAANIGNQQTQAAVDAVLTATVIQHGEIAKDPDTGKEIGWRLSVPLFAVDDMRRKYEIHARRDMEKQTYVLGVALREVPDDTEEEA